MVNTTLRQMKFDPYKHKARTIEDLAAETRAALLEAETKYTEDNSKRHTDKRGVVIPLETKVH